MGGVACYGRGSPSVSSVASADAGRVFTKSLTPMRRHRAGAPRIFSAPGQVAQLVEQRTENPCVGGSSPPLATPEVPAQPRAGRDFFASCSPFGLRWEGGEGRSTLCVGGRDRNAGCVVDREQNAHSPFLSGRRAGLSASPRRFPTAPTWHAFHSPNRRLTMSDRTSPLSSPSSSLSRRSFLSRFAAVGAVGLGGSTLLAACGGDDASTAGASDGAGVVEAASCEGYDALDAQALQPRQALGYVDASPREGQHCGNCRFYRQPEAGSPCGGCQLFAGPVSPGGWCQSWTAQAT